MKRIKPKTEKETRKEMEMDWKPREYPQLVLSVNDVPEIKEWEAGKKYYIELEVQMWEKDIHQNKDKEKGKGSFDILAVHGVESEDDEKKEPKEKGEKQYKRIVKK